MKQPRRGAGDRRRRAPKGDSQSRPGRGAIDTRRARPRPAAPARLATGNGDRGAAAGAFRGHARAAAGRARPVARARGRRPAAARGTRLRSRTARRRPRATHRGGGARLPAGRGPGRDRADRRGAARAPAGEDGRKRRGGAKKGALGYGLLRERGRAGPHQRPCRARLPRPRGGAARRARAARLVAEAKGADLALLATDAPAPAVAAFRTTPLERGEPVTVFGFPLAGVLASDGVVATGTVAALAGPGDDPGLFPIQAPVQPGNSGGPVVDAHGLVVSWAWSWASSMP
ncbi:MAG: serine protease [Geminicoccaceae bacterium]|nr:serine protease [Geminicoccaceae bacterium]